MEVSLVVSSAPRKEDRIASADYLSSGADFLRSLFGLNWRDWNSHIGRSTPDDFFVGLVWYGSDILPHEEAEFDRQSMRSLGGWLDRVGQHEKILFKDLVQPFSWENAARRWWIWVVDFGPK